MTTMSHLLFYKIHLDNSFSPARENMRTIMLLLNGIITKNEKKILHRIIRETFVLSCIW